ncbi:Gfo/Idh/MocA family oxidoreductase [Candidatus Sumerlaeota bacterium]|nr:Gfo/Idh/MocA family oxidoreductase [Candidatus Sumerlaeota bacterium]
MRLAQLGHGYWGRNLLRVFSRVKGAQLILCCDSQPEAREAAQAAVPGLEVCERPEQVFERDDIDGVIIATPARDHFGQTGAALRAGKHVLVEKPLALTGDEAEELVDLADSSGLTLMVGHTFLYNDAVRWVRDFIDRGELGEIYYAYFQRLNLGRVRQDVNALWNLAPHDISIAQYWFSEIPSDVRGHGVSFIQPGIDDVSFVNLFYPSGRFAHIHVSWLDPSKTRRAVVVGSKKMVLYDDTSPDAKIVVYDKGIDRRHPPDAEQFDSFAQFQLLHRAGDVWIPRIGFREPLQVEAQHFVDCVTRGERPLTDGKSGLDVVRILTAAQG